MSYMNTLANKRLTKLRKQAKSLTQVATELLQEASIIKEQQIDDLQGKRKVNTVIIRRNEYDLTRLGTAIRSLKKAETYIVGKEVKNRK